MADYCIVGRKGAGKSLFAVGVIRDALRAGRRVATNLDLNLAALVGVTSRATVLRLPDRPTADDLQALGRGQAGVCEDENGLIVLDETSTFFNARAWGDKARQPLLDWLVHSRKHGWSVWYVCQGLDQIDKQVRTTLVEYLVTVKRTDRWPIPVLSAVSGALGHRITWPKCHIGVIRYGTERDSLIVERRWFRSHELFAGYQTQQIFLPREHPQACGLHSILSGWHTEGRYLPAVPPWYVRVWYGVTGRRWVDHVAAPVKLKPKLPAVVQLERLPADCRIRAWRQAEQAGMLVAEGGSGITTCG